MIALFTSNGCSTCKHVIRDIPDSWASQIKVLRVEFDREAKYFRVYDGDKPLEGRAPIYDVPTLCFFDTGEVYAGYQKIIERLNNGSR